MTDQEIIIEVAKLDGWTNIFYKEFMAGVGADSLPHGWFGNPNTGGYPEQSLPSYLTSRDAIVPVIEKQPAHIQSLIAGELMEPRSANFNVLILRGILTIPHQLCISLLKATGKYKE